MGKMNNDGSGAAAAEKWFRALGDGHRLRILDLLSETEMNAGELLEQLDVVQSTLSHHMKTLCESGLVRARKRGKWTLYTVDREAVASAREYLIRYMEAASPKAQDDQKTEQVQGRQEAARAQAQGGQETAQAQAQVEQETVQAQGEQKTAQVQVPEREEAVASEKKQPLQKSAPEDTLEDVSEDADTISYDSVVRKPQDDGEVLRTEKKAKAKEKAKDKGKDKSKKAKEKDKDGSRDKSRGGKGKDKKKKKDNRF